MFKRVRWMGMGAVAGVGASAWTQRRLRKTLEGHPSIRAGADVVSTARRLGKGIGHEVGAALADGRRAMADRERALRNELDAGGGLDAGRTGRGRDAGHPSASGRDGFIPGGLRVVDATSTVPRPVAARSIAGRPVAARSIGGRPVGGSVGGLPVAAHPETGGRSGAPAGRRTRPRSEPRPKSEPRPTSEPGPHPEPRPQSEPGPPSDARPTSEPALPAGGHAASATTEEPAVDDGPRTPAGARRAQRRRR